MFSKALTSHGLTFGWPHTFREPRVVNYCTPPNAVVGSVKNFQTRDVISGFYWTSVGVLIGISIVAFTGSFHVRSVRSEIPTIAT